MNNPRTVNELMELNDSAARNLLDMMEEGSLDRNDGDRIAALYEAHAPEHRDNQ